VHLQSKVDHTLLSYRALRCVYRAGSTTLSYPPGHCGAPTEQGRPHSPLLQDTAVHLQSKVDRTLLSYMALRCTYRARSTTLSSPTGHCGAPAEQGRPHSPLIQGTAVHLQGKVDRTLFSCRALRCAYRAGSTLSSPTWHCGAPTEQGRPHSPLLHYRALRCTYRARSTPLSSPTEHCGAPTEQGRPHSPLLQGTAVRLQSRVDHTLLSYSAPARSTTLLS
jgi:hypothetical protein